MLRNCSGPTRRTWSQATPMAVCAGTCWSMLPALAPTHRWPCTCNTETLSAPTALHRTLRRQLNSSPWAKCIPNNASLLLWRSQRLTCCSCCESTGSHRLQHSPTQPSTTSSLKTGRCVTEDSKGETHVYGRHKQHPCVIESVTC